MLDFGLDPGHNRSKPHLLHDLMRYLIEQRMAGRLTLLVIDEAQNLSLAALEEVRMLSNLETEKSKLIQVALVGQPNLRDILARPELQQLHQRVTVSYHLQALDAAETAAYINHRLRRAALGAPLELSRDVTDLIHLHSQGLPRKVNVIADAVLLFGYAEEQRVPTVELIHEVLEELEANGVMGPPTETKPASVSTPSMATERAELLAHEERVAERERQLLAQRRVLAEEARLLRSQAALGPAPALWPTLPPDAAGAGAAYARSSAAAPRRIVVPAPPRRPDDAPPPSSSRFWTRVRRGLFGVQPELTK
jgi:hypothetical protein